MRIGRFEDVIAWRKGKILILGVQESINPKLNYNFYNQIFRASLSITNNIAEGFDRGSDRELRQFLIIARGSTAEVRSMLMLSSDFGYLEVRKQTELIELSYEISRLLSGFIKKLETDDNLLVTNPVD